MRMRVRFGGRAVRRPAGVRDAGVPGELLPSDLRGEFGDAALRPHALQPMVADRDARGVVAAVLEPLQALDQDRNDVSLCGGAYDSAHGYFFRGGRQPGTETCR